MDWPTCSTVCEVYPMHCASAPVSASCRRAAGGCAGAMGEPWGRPHAAFCPRRCCCRRRPPARSASSQRCSTRCPQTSRCTSGRAALHGGVRGKEAHQQAPPAGGASNGRAEQQWHAPPSELPAPHLPGRRPGRRGGVGLPASWHASGWQAGQALPGVPTAAACWRARAKE